MEGGFEHLVRALRPKLIVTKRMLARAGTVVLMTVGVVAASTIYLFFVRAETAHASETASTQVGRRNFAELHSIVAYDVKPVKQPTPMSCWAAVYTMMRSWRDGRNLSITDAVADLGDPYLSYLTKDDGLPGGEERTFVKDAGMTALPPASYPLSMFRQLLRDRGPIWITAGDGITAHARLLVGVYSPDENESAEAYERSTMEFIDPEDGTFRYERALDFVRNFEREAAFIVDGQMDKIPLRWQIIVF